MLVSLVYVVMALLKTPKEKYKYIFLMHFEGFLFIANAVFILAFNADIYRTYSVSHSAAYSNDF